MKDSENHIMIEGEKGKNGEILLMRRMRRINRHILGLLQHSHEAHIEALRARHTNRQWRVGLEGSEAWDLADHVLGGLGPGCELGWGDVLFEAEEDCFVLVRWELC